MGVISTLRFFKPLGFLSRSIMGIDYLGSRLRKEKDQSGCCGVSDFRLEDSVARLMDEWFAM